MPCARVYRDANQVGVAMSGIAIGNRTIAASELRTRPALAGAQSTRSEKVSLQSVYLEYLTTIAVGFVAAIVLAERSSLAPLMALGVAIALLLELVTLPIYDRARSLRPLRRILSLSAAAVLTGTAFGWLDTADVRTSMMVLATTLAVPLGARLEYPGRRPARTTLLIGDRVAVSHLITQWGALPQISIDGICLVEPDDDAEDLPAEIMGIPVVGGLPDVPELARSLDVDQVVVAPGPVLTAYDVRRLSWALEDSTIELTVAAEVHGAVPGRIEPRLLGRRLLLSVRPTRRPHIMVWLKSGFDRVAGLLLLIGFAPIIVSLVLLVRSDSDGPGFFKQTRVGRRGRPFTMYKLRSMRTNAEQLRSELARYNEGAGPLFKMTQDPRITRVGRLLRRTSLDELPQLINIVRGEMSLIGPRPALPPETSEYDDWIRRRLTVKPGMTGLWQVSGRSRLAWNEAVRLDLDYVDNWTLGGDVAIAARTLNAVLRRDGAA